MNVRSPRAAVIITLLAVLEVQLAYAQNTTSKSASKLPMLDWIGIAAPQSKVPSVAIWTESSVYISGDDGATFREALTVKGRIVDAGFTTNGTFALARWNDDTASGPWLVDVLPPGNGNKTFSRQVPLPGYLSRFAVGGNVLVGLSPFEGLAVSRDFGRSWQRPKIAGPCSDCEGIFSTEATVSVGYDGTIQVQDIEISTCTSVDDILWARVVRGRAGGPFSSIKIPHSVLNQAAGFYEGAGGLLYGINGKRELVTVRQGKLQKVKSIARIKRMSEIDLASNGKTTIAAIGDHLYELQGMKATKLGNSLPEIRRIAVDGRGRPVVLTGKALHRFSRKTGWKLLGI